jgi:Ala-tRNA(Pro) deacylase
MEASQHSSEAVLRYLEEHGVAYELVEHEPKFTAASEARAAGVEPQNAAKTLALRDHEAYRLAVIPAQRRLALELTRHAVGASAHLRLASEEEMAVDFPAFELGALPPFGPLLPAPEVVDRRIFEHERILCSAGDHAHSVLIDPHELMRIADPQIADICLSTIPPGSPLERY